MNDSIHGGLRVCQSTPLVQLQDRGTSAAAISA